MREDGGVGWRVQAPDGSTWRVRRRWLSRLLLGRPWELVATSDRGEALSVEVSGWHASREKAVQVVELLEAGLPVPGATALLAAEAAETSTAEPQPVEPPTTPPPHAPDRPTTAAPNRTLVWVSTAMLVLSLAALGAAYLGPRWPWGTSCPVPEAAGAPVAGPALPAQLVGAGPLTLDDAVGGKYGSDARRAAIESGTLLGARHEDWLVDEDLVSLRVLTFVDQQRALDYAAVDAETICTHVDSTFTPEGLPGAAGVRQPWRSGPPGWWAGVVVDNTYARAYVRSYREDLGASMVTDALKRAVAGSR